MSEPAATASGRCLTFGLGGELFAVDIACVREILDMTGITRIPHAPGAVRGVVNVRGAAVPVIDLRLLCGMSQAERTVHTRIIIVEIERNGSLTAVGAVADSVKDVLDFPRESISPPPSMGAAVEPGLLIGVGKAGGRFVLILDIAKVLAIDDSPPISGLTAAPSRTGALSPQRG